MTIEWHISEEEEIPFPHQRERKPPRPTSVGWWALCLVTLVLLGSAGFLGGRLWRARENERLLRAELAEVVRAEFQAQAFGLFNEANDFTVVSAPIGWRMAYNKLFYPNAEMPEPWRSPYPTSATWRPPAAAPTLREVTLDESGHRATVELEWQGLSTVTEERAYEQVEGRWRRVPVQVSSQAALRVVSSPHYRLSAPADDLALLDEGHGILEPLEQLYARMDATWAPRYLTQDATLTVTIEVRELTTLLIRNRPDEITLNSLSVGLADTNLPFPPGKQQLILVCSLAATYRVNRLPLRATMGYPPDDGMAYNVLYHLLPQAEAYHLVLNDDELAALRNLWRDGLGGLWFSPFASPKRPEILRLEESGAYYQRWLLASRLLIEYLYVEHALTPGDIVTQVSSDPQRPFVEHIAALTGLSTAEVERRIEQFATEYE